ncbi:hypothetical protein [Rhizobium sp. SSA_523]|uniref:hypothetical protein n=1 Tax=Rhizobium sp. SSA_523 TaxID=2952477 RepID=UPI0020910C89|nr:hypothetical protein [Rhizobium sp. SSA_523]MCO5732612.1 hypothetical protein [Rhizobium sp. SSA_523]WKC23753.1 hypothetical protein QTJ18_23700 [Rhizobium sp. SSA_523]
MPALSEVQLYLFGLWLLVKGDRAGFTYLDISDRGMMRSFWAVVWCLPAIALSWIWWRIAFLEGLPPGQSLGGVFFLRMAMLEAANWLVPIVLAGVLAAMLGIGRHYPAIVVTVNWISVPFAYVYSVMSLLLIMTPSLTGIVALAWLVAILCMIIALSRILRMFLGDHRLMIATLTMVLIVPSLILSDALEQFLGVYPG